MANRKMNIFVLEDDPERIKWFKNTFSDCDLIWTDSIETSLMVLRRWTFDIVFMDRDLGHPNSQDNGEAVAWAMKEEKLAQSACIILHTVNPRGQRVMKRYLGEYHKDVHQIDFTKLKKMNREDFKLN